MKKNRYLSVVFLLALFGLSCGRAFAKPQWETLAARLSAESEQSTRATVARLRAWSGLESTLREALATEKRFLAFDVITALHLENLRPDLERIGEREESGLAYSALNSLLNSGNRGQIVALYLRRVEAAATPPAARMVLLDSLGRLGERIPPAVLARLLENGTPEEKSATLHFLRSRLRAGDRSVLSLMPPLFRAKPYQLRVQLAFMVGEFGLARQGAFAGFLRDCARDEEKDLREVCRSISAGKTK
jgi:hypothetical protein